MVKRISALRGHYTPGKIGMAGQCGVSLAEIRDLSLHQVAAWPDSLAEVGTLVADAAGADRAAAPGEAVSGDNGTLLRIEPLKWWVIGSSVPALEPAQGATLDLSHSRTHMRIAGEHATTLLSRVLPLDFRPRSFPLNSVASSAMHHVGVTLWHSDSGFELFVPRGFALSVWEVLVETAEQFGAEID